MEVKIEKSDMEYVITAKAGGTVKQVNVAAGDMVEGGDLFIELE
jgi:biotin carboxyl carrier protein